MADDPQPAKKAWTTFMGGVGNLSALIGLGVTLFGGVTWYLNHRAHQAELADQRSTAQSQAAQGDYQASLQTYADILKANPLDQPALDGQLAATELWVEDFHIVSPESDTKSASTAAAAALDQIFALLDAARARAKGPQLADIQAHLGWAHWLNHHIAQREFDSAPQQYLRTALQTDPSNVFANAMLGNWILQNHGDFAEAIHRFDVALSTGKARPLVRRMELGGLLYDDVPGARAALFKTADQMRHANEPLDQDERSRILGFCCDPSVTSHAELIESLSAVPPADAWQTYLWLDDRHPQDSSAAATQLLVRDFIQANLLEISGQRQPALATFRDLHQRLKNQSTSMARMIDESLIRLSKP